MTTSALSAAAAVAMFGLAVGSFCTVVIWRVPRGESIVAPGSACVHCAEPVPFWLNVPLFGWLMLRGRTRCCGASLSMRYPLVEAGVSLAWVLLAWELRPAWLLAAALPFAAGAVCVGVIDAEHRRIPHPISGSLALFAVIGSVVIALTVVDPPSGAVLTALWVPSACGLGASSALWTLRFFKPSAMGGGDVRFVFSCVAVPAAVAGPGASLVAMFAAITSAALFGVAVKSLRSRRGSTDSHIAFGPHLGIGAVLAVLWGDHWWSAYASLLG